MGDERQATARGGEVDDFLQSGRVGDGGGLGSVGHGGRGGRRRGFAIDAELDAHALGDGGEFHIVEEGEQGLDVGRLEGEIVEVVIDGAVFAQGDEIARQARLIGERDQVFATLVLFDLGRAFQQRIEIAVFVDEQRGGFDADAGHAGNVVDRIAGEGLDVDHAVRADAEFFLHLVGADGARLHRIEHGDVAADELHEVFVGRDDHHFVAMFARHAHIGGDDVVGLEAFFFDDGDVEGARGLADIGELRGKIVGRFVAVGFVVFEDLVAKGF